MIAYVIAATAKTEDGSATNAMIEVESTPHARIADKTTGTMTIADLVAVTTTTIEMMAVATPAADIRGAYRRALRACEFSRARLSPKEVIEECQSVQLWF